MDNIAQLKFWTRDHYSIERLFLRYVEMGWILHRAYTKRKFLFFGVKRYYVVMKKGEIMYADEIAAALEEERYEDVDRLKKEFEKAKELNFYMT